MTTQPLDGTPQSLEQRIDALVARLDGLLLVVGKEAKLRKRLSNIVIAIVVVMALGVVGIFTWSAHVDRKHACENQNATRQVLRDLLTAAKDATPTLPPAQATPTQIEQFRQQNARTLAFYADRLAAVQPLGC